MDSMVTLYELMDSFSTSEKRVAKYFLEERAKILTQSIGDVARACSTSKTTVVRLCKLAGFKGYKEFCMALSADLAKKNDNFMVYEDVVQSKDFLTAIQQVTKRNTAGIENTIRMISGESLEKTVELFNQAKRVDFYGQGSSGIVALDAQSKFMRIGKYSFTSLDPHVQVVFASTLKKGDVAVLFSYSGETKDTLETCDVCQSCGASVIAVTKYAPNPLAKKADIHLSIVSSEPDIRTGAMASRIAMLNIVDVLFSAVTALEYQRGKPILDRSLKAAKLKKSKST